ncbi:MAG: hypothetical protein S4CHLAM7_09840 [Chlamydiae bacterium]|nr:hypothetical protein [Chlamydiota bacterium]
MPVSKEIFKNIRKIQIRTNKYVQDVLAGAYQSAFKGRGMEFEDVREYQPGDEVRSIDWNVTARMQNPYVKNFKEERELTVLLLVDLSASSLFGTTGKQKEELIAEIGALLAFSASKNQDKVGLILFTDKVEKYISPKKGLKHVLRVIRELLLFKPEGKKTDLSKALQFLLKIQKKRGVVFILSDFFSPSFKDELLFASKRHDVIGVNVRDPQEMTIPKLGLIQFKDLETNKVQIVDTSLKKVRKRIEEKNLNHLKEIQKQFENIGGGFINVLSGPSYMNAIQEFFKRRVQRV